jgi:glyoxylase-like metal-dependent hydrolase (beta-lactamase superfamily II)
VSALPTIIPVSDHFSVAELADGVFAAIGNEEGAAYSNAGFVDLGDRTLVFDTFMTPGAGRELRAAAEELTGRPATYVVNSHEHLDHWCGNQAFGPETLILSTDKSRAGMVPLRQYLLECRENPEELEELIRDNVEQLQTEKDERLREYLERANARLRHTIQGLSTIEPRLPELSFDQRLVMRGSRRRAVLVSFENGHSPSDCALILPRERVAFLGDMALFEMHPLLANGDPRVWEAQLEEIEEWYAETFVPGHGPVGSKDHIHMQRRYIGSLMDLVEDVVEGGGSVEDAITQPIPELFEEWTLGLGFFETNIRFLYNLLSGQNLVVED